MSERRLESYLRHLAAEGPLYYFPNHGNAGDSLIAYATYRLFHKLGIPYRLIRDARRFDATGKIVLYGGGGNLVEGYGCAHDFIAAHHRRARRLVVLPHTVSGHGDLLDRLGPNVEILCREPVSQAYLKRRAPHLNTRLMHDVALTLDVGAALESPIPVVAGGLTARWWRDTRRLWRWRLTTPRSKRTGTLNAFRTDDERALESLPPDNIDLSRRLAYDDLRPVAVAYVSRRLLAFIDRFERVRTDRLHVCIAAALLGKEVEFHPNSYYKCEAVWHHSLRERFPRVRWAGNAAK